MSESHVLLIGDSHLAGVGDPDGAGWVGPVLDAAEEAGLEIAATKLAVEAETFQSLAREWPDRALDGLERGSHGRVVIALGMNDADPIRRPEPARLRRSVKLLGTLIDEAIEVGLSLYVVGPAPVLDLEHRMRIGELSQRFTAVCEERQVPYTEVFGPLVHSSIWMDELRAGDGVHPEADGYAVLADLLVDAGLLDWLGRPLRIPQGLPHRRTSGPPASSTGNG